MSTAPSATTGAEPPNQLLASISRRLDDVANDVKGLTHDIRGNGEIGLKQRMGRAEGHLYHNPKTGDPGLVARVATLDSTLTGLRAQLRLLNWMLGIFGTTGVAGAIVWFARLVFGPGG